MSHSYSVSMDDDDPFSAPSPAVTSGDVRLRDRPAPPSAATRQTSRHSGEWSTRLSTSGSTSGSSRRDTALPPTRQGVLKPEDTVKVDAFRLVKQESSPLSITAKETLSVLEKQKQAQKETRTFKNTDDDDIDWEQNLSSWKSRRKSKSSYQSKGLETEGGDDDMEDSSSNAKKSKTFKELMDQKEKRSNGHSMYTYDNQERPAAVETLSTSSSKRETQPTRADTKHDDLPKQSEPQSSGRVSSSTAKQSSTTASESHSTSRNNLTEAPDRRESPPPPASTTTARTSGYISSEVGHGTRTTHSGTVPVTRDSDAESYSTSRYNLTEAPAGKASDGGGESRSTSRYHTSEHVSEVGHGTRPSSSKLLSDRSVSERDSEQRQKPFELTVDLQVQTPKPATDSADLLQKKTTTTTTESSSSSSSSVRPLHTELTETRSTSWQASSTKPKSENYGVTAPKTTSAFEVQMREKPKRSEPPPPLARPSSYTTYTPSTTRLQSDVGRPTSTRVETTAKLPTGSVSNRDSFTGSGGSSRPVGGGVGAWNPTGVEGRARDRRAMSTFELNFEKSFRPPPKSVGVGGDVNASSSRFKQTLSLFQNKESEGGGSGPVKAHPPPLGTQRSVGVGKISRLPGEGIKPSYSVVEMRRGSAVDRRYGEPPAVDTTSSSYKTDAARLRGVSRSVQGLDTYRTSDFGIPDSRNSSALSRDRSDRYGSRDFGRAEVSDGNSMETGSSRAHSSDEEREKVIPRNASGRSSADVDKPLESRASLQLGPEADRREVDPKKRYDANGTSGSAGVGVRSSYSHNETLDSDNRTKVSGKPGEADLSHRSITVSRYSSLYDTGVNDKPTSYSTSTKTTTDDWDKKPVSNIHRDDNQRTTTTVTSSTEIRSEPKDLYAYKHRSPLMEESVIGNRDIGKQTAKHVDNTTRRYDDKSPDRKSSHNIESLKTDPAMRYDKKESYGRDEYKKPDAAPLRASYQEPEKSGLRDLQRVGQQTSISDIFSKRSAAVIRGTSVVPETESHEAALATSAGFTGRSAAERKMARMLENTMDDTIKEFQVADRTTRTRDEPSATGAGDVTRAKMRHDQDEPFQRTDYDVTSVTRTTRDAYGSDKRHHGLERASDRDELGEPLSHRTITLSERKQEDKGVHPQQPPSFEVNFSVSGAENKPNRSGEAKLGKTDVEIQERKSGHHEESPAFELNFSVSELERQRRLEEDKAGKSNVGERQADNQKKTFVIEEKIITRDEKISLGDHRNVDESQKPSYQTHDSFHHRPTESVARHVVSSDTKMVAIGDRDSPKGNRNEFEIAIDTRGLYSDRSSSEKRAPAVAMSTDPKTLRSGVQQELILEFPGSKAKEPTKREPVTDDFYFGMTGGTSEEVNKKTTPGGRPAELVVEIPIPEEIRLSRVDRLQSQKDKSSPEEHIKPLEHKLPSHDHELPPPYKPKLPTEEHKLKSQESKTELKTPSKEQKLPTMEHRSSPIPSRENKSRPEERKIPSPQDHELPPPYKPKLPTEVDKSSPLEHKASSKEQKRPSEENIFPSHERKLPREERRSPPREPETPPSEPEEDRSPSPDHRLSPLPSPEHKPVEHKPVEHKPVEHKSVEHKPVEHKPVEHKGSWPMDEKPTPLSSNTKIGLSIDLDSHLATVPPTTASDKRIIAELDSLLDGPRFDLNSNISTDTKKTPPAPPRSTLIPKDETHHPPSSFDPSHGKTAEKTTVVATPADKSRTSDEPNGFLASPVLDGGGDSATEDGAKTSSVPKKKPPAPPPKTKPKPTASKVPDAAPAVEKDDWGFLSSSERLDVSVSKDKSRLLTTAPMGARRRPKSIMFPLPETSDPFDQAMTTDQNSGPSKMEENGHGGGGTKLDGSDSDHTANTPGSATPPTPLTAVEQLPPATRMKSKGVRPVSYMEELNSSLFKKKMKDTTETPSDDDEAESKPPTSKHYKMEDVTPDSGEHSKAIVRSSSSIRRKDDEDGKDEGQAREMEESPGAEKSRHGGGVKIPGLMDELNFSFKKKRPENIGDSREEGKNPERKPVSVEVATGDLLNFSDDKNDDEGEAPPPPLPNAPPPLPNWNAFPGGSSTDPLLGPPSGPPPGLPSGPPPGPPSGPPPPGQSLLDLSFLEDEPGQLHFRTTGLSVDQSHSQGKGKTFQSSAASDDMDFSFA